DVKERDVEVAGRVPTIEAEAEQAIAARLEVEDPAWDDELALLRGRRRVREVDGEERIGLGERDGVGPRAVEADGLQRLLAREVHRRVADADERARRVDAERVDVGVLRAVPRREDADLADDAEVALELVHLPAARDRAGNGHVRALQEMTGRVGDVEDVDLPLVARRALRVRAADVEALLRRDDAAPER